MLYFYLPHVWASSCGFYPIFVDFPIFPMFLRQHFPWQKSPCFYGLLVHRFVVGLLPTRLTIGGAIAGLPLLGTAEEAPSMLKKTHVWRLKSVETIDTPMFYGLNHDFFWAESQFWWVNHYVWCLRKTCFRCLVMFSRYFYGLKSPCCLELILIFVDEWSTIYWRWCL